MKYRFDEIAVNSTSKKLPEDSDKEHYIGLEHLDSCSLTVTRWGAEVAPTGEKLLMKKGDVLFGKRRAYQRKVGIAPFDGIFSAHGMVLRPNENIVTKEFFPFFISSDQFMERAVRISVGGLSPTINWKDLRVQEFELPPIEEQRVLADKLWAAYRLKESYRRLLAATQEMVKSQFIEMFGDPETNSKNWQLSTFGENFDISSGGTPDTKNEKYWGGDVSWIGSNMCQNELLYTNDGKFITHEGYKNCSAKIYPVDTVLVALVGATIGKVALLKFETSTNQNVAGIQVRKNEDFLPMFIFFLLQSMYNRFFMLGMGKFKMASLGFIRKLPLIKPPLDLQEQFVAIAEQADKSGFELRKSIDAIDNVIKSLINNQS